MIKQGTVKFYNLDKDFGFIIEDGNLSELFVHVTGLIDRIKEGDKVNYEVVEGKKGMTAVQVRLAR